MSKVHLPFDELAAAQVVALEAPPRMPQHFERTLLQFITKVRARGPHVAIVVAPQAKRQSQVALWIHKWNHLEQAPFRFKRQCSCQIGGTESVHLTLFTGSSIDMGEKQGCGHVPTPGCSALALKRTFGGILLSLATAVSRSGWAFATTPVAFQPPLVTGRLPAGVSTALLPPRTGSSEDVPAAGSQQAPDSRLSAHPIGGSLCAETDQRNFTPSNRKSTTAAYPTDSKEKERNRRNKMKAEGQEIVVKKKKKFHVEDHYDDCGEDLSSLGPDSEFPGLRPMPPTPLRICPLIFWVACSAHEFAKLIFEISLGSWKHARGMAPSAREFAKLIFEISLGSWRHVRGMARSAREFAKLTFEISLLRCPVFLVRLIEL